MKLPLITRKTALGDDAALFHVLALAGHTAIGVNELNHKIERVQISDLTVLTEEEYIELEKKKKALRNPDN